MVVDAERHLQAALGAQRGQRRPVQDEATTRGSPRSAGCSAGSASTSCPSCANVAARQHEPGRARARRCRTRRSATAGRRPAACSSSRASPVSGRSAAGPTCPGRTASGWTSTTSRTGRSPATSRSSGRRCPRSSAATAPTDVGRSAENRQRYSVGDRPTYAPRARRPRRRAARRGAGPPVRLLPHQGGRAGRRRATCWSTAAPAIKSDRVQRRRLAGRDHPGAARRPAGRGRAGARAWSWSTTTTTSSWSTSRSAWPRTRAPAGPGRRSSAGWPAPATGSPPAASAERQGVVHRLDVGTSGLMVVAKSERAYTALKRAFKERTVDKTYHALVQGHPDPLRGTVDAPIDRHPSHDYRWAVVAERQAERHPLRDARGAPGGQPARDPPGDRPDPPDPGAHGGAAAPVRRRPDLRRRPDAVRVASG